MRNATIITSLSISVLIIVSQFGIWDSLLLFLLVGTIPGTSLSLSPVAMLIGLSVLVAAGTLALLYEVENSVEVAKKALPKKRYNRI